GSGDGPGRVGELYTTQRLRTAAVRCRGWLGPAARPPAYVQPPDRYRGDIVRVHHAGIHGDLVVALHIDAGVVRDTPTDFAVVVLIRLPAIGVGLRRAVRAPDPAGGPP